MIATITSTQIQDPNIASPMMYHVTLHTPIMEDAPVTCYSIKAVMVLMGKYEVQHVRYTQTDQDGLLIAHLAQLGITVK